MNKCPFCHDSATSLIYDVRVDNKLYSPKSNLKVCKGCGLYYISPIPQERRLSRVYAGIYHYSPSKLRDILVSLYSFYELRSDFNLINRFKKEGKVLDIGAGRGDFLLKFPSGKWERWAHDPYLSKQDIKLLEKKLGKNVNHYSRLRDYPGNTFAVVVLRNVIEHTAEFSMLLEEAYRILEDGGVLFIRTPNIGSLDFKNFRNNWYVVTMSGHVIFFDKKSLPNYVRKAGFRVEVNKPTSRSALLSYFRSSTKNIPTPIKIGVSCFYSLFSPMFGEGGDLRMIAQK